MHYDNYYCNRDDVTQLPLRKCTVEYKSCKSQQKSNHLMYIDDTKLVAKNEKKLETLI